MESSKENCFIENQEDLNVIEIEEDIIERLFQYKESLLVVKDNKRLIYSKTGFYLDEINSMLERYPQHSENLYKWNFLGQEALYLLRSRFFGKTVDIIVKIIRNVKKVPNYFLTLKFIYFLNEKLYEYLKLYTINEYETGESYFDDKIRKIDIGVNENSDENHNLDIDNIRNRYEYDCLNESYEYLNISSDNNKNISDCKDYNKNISDCKAYNKNISDCKDYNKDISDCKAYNKNISDCKDYNKNISDCKAYNKNISDFNEFSEEFDTVNDRKKCNDLKFKNKDFNLNCKMKNVDNCIISSLDEIGCIIRLFNEILVNKITCLNLLHETGSFILINSIVSEETCKLYSTIFKNKFYSDKTYPYKRRRLGSEVCYEVKRKMFDPEVVLREKEILELKRNEVKYVSGIYKKIYEECCILRELFDLNVEMSLDILLFRRTVFMNSDLDLLIRNKNGKAVKIYRRSLESGCIPDNSYLTILIQLLDHNETKLDACLSIYYYLDTLDNTKQFTENRIRRIFECLEYECSLECPVNAIEDSDYDSHICKSGYIKNNELDFHKGSYKDSIENDDLNIRRDSILDENSDLQNKESFVENGTQYNNGDLKYKGLIKENSSLNEDLNKYFNKNEKDNMMSFDEKTLPDCTYRSIENTNISIVLESVIPETKDNQKKHVQGISKHQNDIDRSFCDRLKIVRILKHLYKSTKKTFFYKPSFLILLKAQIRHCSVECDFINEYFKDFVYYVEHGKNTLAKALFPHSKRESAKKNTMSKEDVSQVNETFFGYNKEENSSDADNILIAKINRMKSLNKSDL